MTLQIVVYFEDVEGVAEPPSEIAPCVARHFGTKIMGEEGASCLHHNTLNPPQEDTGVRS